MNMSQLSTGDGREEDPASPEPDMYASVEIPVKKSHKWTESESIDTPGTPSVY